MSSAVRGGEFQGEAIPDTQARQPRRRSVDSRPHRKTMGKARTVYPEDLEVRARYLPGGDGSQDLASPGEDQGVGARQGTQTPEIQTASELEDLEATKQDRQHPHQNSGQVIPMPQRALRCLELTRYVQRSERHYHPKSTSRHS